MAEVEFAVGGDVGGGFDGGPMWVGVAVGTAVVGSSSSSSGGSGGGGGGEAGLVEAESQAAAC